MTESTAPSATSPQPGTGNVRVDRMLHVMMGSAHLESAELTGPVLTLRYRQADAYFVNDEFVARLVIGAAFGLLYRCGLGEVHFHFMRDGQDVPLHVSREAFAAFFGLDEEQMAALAADPARFDASPVHRVTEARQWEFYLQFTKDA